jgi:hypothetical protein
MPHQRRCKQVSSSESVSEQCSDSESIDSEIRRLQEKKERRDKKKAHKKLECLEEKLDDNKHKDKHLEHKVLKLEHKLKHNAELDRKWRLKYKNIVYRLRREKCLFVNGADSYGSFYSTSLQTIPPNGSIIFDKQHNVLNLEFTNGTTDIKILRGGVYTLGITCQFDQPAQVCFFVNGMPDLTTVTASNSGAHIVTVHQLFTLNVNDIVSFRNHISNTSITTSLPASGTVLESQNVDFTMYRIAPLPTPCCLPPCLNDRDCVSESSGSECSHSEHDSESEKSHSSKFCKENSHKSDKYNKKCKKDSKKCCKK